MAGVGPMQGQVNHFLLYAPEKIECGIKRFSDETKRLFSVIEEYLRRNRENGPYLVGNHYFISEIAVYGWAKFLGRINIDSGNRHWQMNGLKCWMIYQKSKED